MAWKNERMIWKFNIPKSESDSFYAIVRQYCRMNDIVKTDREDGRIGYSISLRNKNISRLQHDIQVAIMCGLNIKMGV